MRNLFAKVEVSSSCCLGKRDRKDINRQLGHEVLEADGAYTVHKCKNKASVVSKDGSAVLFHFNRKYFPTIRHLSDHGEGFCEVVLDEGAAGPLGRGADVMAPGVLKYKDLVRGSFEPGDAVAVRILGGAVVAVGEARMSLKDIVGGATGVCVEVYHKAGDGLDVRRWA